MSFVNRTAQGLLNYLLSKTSVFDTQPTLSLAAFTADPTEAGVLTNEVNDSGTAYARIENVAGSFADATNADPSAVVNNAAISFPEATGAGFGTVTHVALVDSAVEGSGNVIAVAAMTPSRQIDDGEALTFPIGDLTFTLD